MTETPRPDPWKDVPLAIRREAHECATSNGRINPEYLAGLYRRGAQARTVVDHNGEVLTQAAVDRLLIDRGEQAETIRQLQATLPELHDAIERQSAQIAALTQERDEARAEASCERASRKECDDIITKYGFGRAQAEIATLRATIGEQQARIAELQKEIADREVGTVKDVAYMKRQDARITALEAALTRLRDCDWTIGRGDRMDPVREIARQALETP